MQKARDFDSDGARASPARRRALGGTLAAFAAVFSANALGVIASSVTGEVMRGASALAEQALEYRQQIRPLTLGLTFPTTAVALLAYLAPLLRQFAKRPNEPASQIVRSRTVRAPLALALIASLPWLATVVGLPLLTRIEFGRWSADLLSQEVLSPLVSGFLASTTSFLLVEWIFRRSVVPFVFPRGDVPAGRSVAVGVSARLVVLAFAIAFVPMFTMLGLVAAVDSRIELGADARVLVPLLSRSTSLTFLAFSVLGALYTFALARSLTRPLTQTARALERIREGDLGSRLRVESADEIGALMQGVNDLATTLAEREHILQTFGRAVEPAVRDRLLAGDLASSGETRNATVLFCDLRGFTAMSEREDPRAVVATLNRVFAELAGWARECGGHVDKFIGDAMLVVFGLFDDSTNAEQAAAAAALRCGLGMHERMAAVNAALAAEGEPPLALGVGIHAGEVVAGTIGAVDRHEYTVIGDTVNVASRLQDLCRSHGTTVLVSAPTLAAAGVDASSLAGSPAANVTLRGRQSPVSVFSLG